MFFSGVDASNTTGGEILIVYECMFTDRTSDYGFTMTVRDKSIAQMLVRTLLNEEARRFSAYFAKDKEVKKESDLSPDQRDRWFSERNKWLRCRGRLARDVIEFCGLRTVGDNPLTAQVNPVFYDGTQLYSNKPHFDNSTGVLLVGSFISDGSDDFYPQVGNVIAGANGGLSTLVSVVGNTQSSIFGGAANNVVRVSTAGSLTTLPATAVSSSDGKAQSVISGKTSESAGSSLSSAPPVPAPLKIQEKERDYIVVKKTDAPDSADLVDRLLGRAPRVSTKRSKSLPRSVTIADGDGVGSNQPS